MYVKDVETKSASRNPSRVRVKVYERGWELNLGVGVSKQDTARATAVLSLDQTDELIASLQEARSLIILNKEEGPSAE